MTAVADIGSVGRPTVARPPATMRAAVVSAPGSIEVVDVPLPKPKDSEVRVRLEGCGVCASNVPAWEGREWFKYPMPPGHLGHEAWGMVDEVGAAVTKFHPGQRVAMLGGAGYADYDVAAEDQVVALPRADFVTPVPILSTTPHASCPRWPGGMGY